MLLVLLLLLLLFTNSIKAVYRGDCRNCTSNPAEISEDWLADERLAQATGMNDPNYKFHPSPKRLSPQERAQLQRP